MSRLTASAAGSTRNDKKYALIHARWKLGRNEVPDPICGFHTLGGTVASGNGGVSFQSQLQIGQHQQESVIKPRINQVFPDRQKPLAQFVHWNTTGGVPKIIPEGYVVLEECGAGYQEKKPRFLARGVWVTAKCLNHTHRNHSMLSMSFTPPPYWPSAACLPAGLSVKLINIHSGVARLLPHLRHVIDRGLRLLPPNVQAYTRGRSFLGATSTDPPLLFTAPTVVTDMDRGQGNTVVKHRSVKIPKPSPGLQDLLELGALLIKREYYLMLLVFGGQAISEPAAIQAISAEAAAVGLVDQPPEIGDSWVCDVLDAQRWEEGLPLHLSGKQFKIHSEFPQLNIPPPTGRPLHEVDIHLTHDNDWERYSEAFQYKKPSADYINSLFGPNTVLDISSVSRLFENGVWVKPQPLVIEKRLGKPGSSTSDFNNPSGCWVPIDTLTEMPTRTPDQIPGMAALPFGYSGKLLHIYVGLNAGYALLHSLVKRGIDQLDHTSINAAKASVFLSLAGCEPKLTTAPMDPKAVLDEAVVSLDLVLAKELAALILKRTRLLKLLVLGGQVITEAAAIHEMRIVAEDAEIDLGLVIADFRKEGQFGDFVYSSSVARKGKSDIRRADDFMLDYCAIYFPLAKRPPDISGELLAYKEPNRRSVKDAFRISSKSRDFAALVPATVSPSHPCAFSVLINMNIVPKGAHIAMERLHRLGQHRMVEYMPTGYYVPVQMAGEEPDISAPDCVSHTAGLPFGYTLDLFDLYARLGGFLKALRPSIKNGAALLQPGSRAFIMAHSLLATTVSVPSLVNAPTSAASAVNESYLLAEFALFKEMATLILKRTRVLKLLVLGGQVITEPAAINGMRVRAQQEQLDLNDLIDDSDSLDLYDGARALPFVSPLGGEDVTYSAAGNWRKARKEHEVWQMVKHKAAHLMFSSNKNGQAQRGKLFANLASTPIIFSGIWETVIGKPLNPHSLAHRIYKSRDDGVSMEAIEEALIATAETYLSRYPNAWI